MFSKFILPLLPRKLRLFFNVSLSTKEIVANAKAELRATQQVQEAREELYVDLAALCVSRATKANKEFNAARSAQVTLSSL